MQNRRRSKTLAAAISLLVGLCLPAAPAVSSAADYETGGHIRGVDSRWHAVREERNVKKTLGVLLDRTAGYGTFAVAGAPRTSRTYGPVFSNVIRLPLQTAYEVRRGNFDFHRADLIQGYDVSSIAETYARTMNATAIDAAMVAGALETRAGGGAFGQDGERIGWDVSEVWKEPIVEISLPSLFRLLRKLKPEEFSNDLTLGAFIRKMSDGGLISEAHMVSLVEKAEALGLALEETMGIIITKPTEYGLAVRVSLQGLVSYGEYLGISEDLFLRNLLLLVQSGEIQLSGELLAALRQSIETATMESELLTAELVTGQFAEEGFDRDEGDVDLREKRHNVALAQHFGIAEPVLSLAKSCDRRAVVFGQRLRFRLTLRNEGNAMSTAPIVVEVLPKGTKVLKKSLSSSPVKPRLLTSEGRDCLIWVLKKPLPPEKAGYDPVTLEYSVELQTLEN